MRYRYIPVLIFLLASAHAVSQTYSFSVAPHQTGMLPVPVFVSMDNIHFDPSSQVPQLFMIEKKGRVEVPCQFEQAGRPGLWFIPPGKVENKKSREFLVEIRDMSGSASPSATVVRDEKDIKLGSKKSSILAYRYATTEAPEGADYHFRKSGYIHPLYTPEGKILTRIQPPDHYHHYGIWAPWTKVQVGQNEIDMWNLILGEATVRFGGLLSTTSGEVYCGFKVRQEHVDFTARGEDRVIFNEILEIRAFPLEFEGRDIWLIDYTTSLNKSVSDSVVLKKYRYGGGIGFRASGELTAPKSKVFTSEGLDHETADASEARWCDISGDINGGISGICFFSHPKNPSHPEPMRVWPKDMTENGDMFFEFCPIRHRSIVLEDNTDLVFRYRMIVYDGQLPVELLNKAWQEFANTHIVREITIH